jgi:hypothetical protein
MWSDVSHISVIMSLYVACRISHSGSYEPVSHIPLAMSLLCGLPYLSHSASYEPVKWPLVSLTFR